MHVQFSLSIVATKAVAGPVTEDHGEAEEAWSLALALCSTRSMCSGSTQPSQSAKAHCLIGVKCAANAGSTSLHVAVAALRTLSRFLPAVGGEMPMAASRLHCLRWVSEAPTVSTPALALVE